MRRLWGRANSSNVMKVIWLLEELRLPYERIDLGGPFGGNDSPEYRAMNPNGVVPTLQEADGFTLWESNAILRYLCNAEAPDSPFYPRGPRARAEVDRWLDWQQTTLNAPQSAVFQGLIRTAPEKRDQAAITRGIEGATRAWSILDARLAGRAHVTGEALTLADMAFGPHVHRWFFFPFGKPDLPNLRAWYDRLMQRPAYAKHVAIAVT